MKLLEIPAENCAAAPCSAPSLHAEAQCVCPLGFTSLLLKLFPKKPLSAHVTKLLPIFTQKALTGLQSVAASNVSFPSLLFSRTFGFPSPSMAWPRAGWMRGCSRQLLPCSSGWVQWHFAFNYTVLFPTSAWLLTPSWPGTCTTGGNATKTPTWDPRGGTAGAV